MNTCCKTLLFLSAFSLLGIYSTNAHAAAADSNVKVQVNDELVNFPDNQPYLDSNNRVEVPVRAISEKLGYKVDWQMDGNQSKVTIQSPAKSIVLRTGETVAVINGNTVPINAPAVLTDQGRTYVPIRFVSETLGTPVQWDDSNSVAIVDVDGKSHQSVWHASKGPQIAETARKFVGVPYAWGGTSTSGFDCSGFARYVFQQNGLELPRTASEMYHQAGTSVSNLQVGDLVFFSTYNSDASHVGIYLGNNQFISSTSSYGVHIDSFSNPYWGPRYLGAKRISA